jgi:hypothetical protein
MAGIITSALDDNVAVAPPRTQIWVELVGLSGTGASVRCDDLHIVQLF